MANDKQNTSPNVPNTGNVPRLRFPEFTEEWVQVPLSEISERVTRKNKNNISKLPLTISAQYGLVDQITFFNKVVASADMSNYYLLKKGEFAYNKSYSSDYPWGTIKRLDRYDEGALSTLYICFNIKKCTDSDFAVQYFESPKWHREVSNIAGEGARNHGLLNIAVGDFFNTKHYLPSSIDEQQKIAKLLSLLDQRIATQNKIIEDLKKLKVAIRDKQLNAIRKHYGVNYQICDLLDYEQPTKYVVTDTEYSDDISKTPVLTANKAFILGYTNETFGVYDKGKCIILDDFTLDCKYVDFPFKVKSSAIKILTVKNGYSLRYVYEYLNYLNLETTEHKRHYISEIEPMMIAYPTDKKKINDFNNMMSSLERKIEIENKYLQSLLAQKAYLLINMFI